MNKKSIAAIVLAVILGASSYFLDGKDLDGAIKILTDKEAAVLATILFDESRAAAPERSRVNAQFNLAAERIQTKLFKAACKANGRLTYAERTERHD